MTEFLVPIAGKFPGEGVTPEDLLQSIEVPGASEPERRSVICDVRAAIIGTFRDKTPAFGGEKPMLVHLQGPPGAGKSWWADRLYSKTLRNKPATHATQKTFAWCSYDENGIIEFIRRWQRECPEADPAKPFDMEQYLQRLRARDDVRQATWIGRDLVLNMILTEYYSGIIDTVGHNQGILKLMDVSRKRGFGNSVLSVYAPYEISKARVLGRRRAIDIKEELIGKRHGALRMLPPVIDSVRQNKESLSLFYNPENASLPALATRIENGVLVYRNETYIRRMIAAAAADLHHPDLLPFKEDFLSATENFLLMLEDLAFDPRPDPGPPAPTGLS